MLWICLKALANSCLVRWNFIQSPFAQVIQMQRERSRSRIRHFELCDGSWTTLQKIDIAYDFEDLWNMRPPNQQDIVIRGRSVPIPRRQLAMGHSYPFSGQVASAVETDNAVASMLTKVRFATGVRFNGVLMNFYEGSDYIGPHSDESKPLVKNAPIATLSLGGTRRFWIRPKNDGEEQKLTVENGDLLVMWGRCQETHKHEVRRPLKTDMGAFRKKRISVTFRQFA
jgi:alkylated DNA repair dioxygenase AlkB